MGNFLSFTEQALEARGDEAATWLASKLRLPPPNQESVTSRKEDHGQNPDLPSAKDEPAPTSGTERAVPHIDEIHQAAPVLRLKQLQMLLLQVTMQLAEFDGLYPATLRKYALETRGLLVDAYGELMREAGRADGMTLQAVLGCQAVQSKIKGVRFKIREMVEEITNVLLHMRGLLDPSKPQMVGRKLSTLTTCAQKGEQALLPYLERLGDIHCRLFEAAHAGSYNHVAGFLREGPLLEGVLNGYMEAVQGYAELHMHLPKAFLVMMPASFQQLCSSHKQQQQCVTAGRKMNIIARWQRRRQQFASSIAAGLLHDAAAADRVLRLATRYYICVVRVRSEGLCQGLEHEEGVALFNVAASMSHVAVLTLTAHDEAMGFGSQGCMERALGHFKAAAGIFALLKQRGFCVAEAEGSRGAFAFLKQRASWLLGQPPQGHPLSRTSLDFLEKLMLVQAKECLHNIRSSAGEPSKEIAIYAGQISRNYEELKIAFSPLVATVQPHLSYDFLSFKSWLYLTRKLQSGAAVLSHSAEQHDQDSPGARHQSTQKAQEEAVNKKRANSNINKGLGLRLLEDALQSIQAQMLLPCAFLQGHPDILVSLKAFEESIMAAKTVAAQNAKGMDDPEADSQGIKACAALKAITSVSLEPIKACVPEEILYPASPHHEAASDSEYEEEGGAAPLAPHTDIQDAAGLEHPVMKLNPGSLLDLSEALGWASSLERCVTLDLGGHVFCGDFPEQLALTHSVTLCNGTLELMGNCHLSIFASHGVWLKGLAIRGHGEQSFMVDICGGSRVHMLDCMVEGGGRPNVDGRGGAVGVQPGDESAASVLEAERCNMVSSSRCGLQVVGRGAKAVLRHCRSCGCMGNGWMVEHAGSSLAAQECEVSGNGESNLFVGWGASAALQGCCLQGSKFGRGLRIWGSGSAATLTSCKLTGNKECNANVSNGASAALFACELDSSEGNGLTVAGKGSFVTASAVSISSCKESNVLVYAGGAAVLLGGCACNNSKQGAGWRVHGSTSSLAVHASSAKGGAQDGCGYSEAEGGMILYL